MTIQRKGRLATVALLTVLAAACGSSGTSTDQAAVPTSAAPGVTEAATPPTEAVTPATEATSTGGEDGASVVLAVNPWTGSAANANVAKLVLEDQLKTKVELVDIDEFATWTGLDDGSIDAVLEVWPSGHGADYDKYVTEKKSVVDIGKLGPSAKIGWYVPSFVIEEHPELKTSDGFKDPALAKLFATAETGDKGQFLMGDPTYVTFDEQIIANLGLPLQYVVGGSEAAVITALQKSVEDKKPVLVQFWKPHWLHLSLDLTEVELPASTPACETARGDESKGVNCDYPADVLYKAANAGLEAKNAAAFAFLSKFQLTTDQQSEIAGYVDRDGLDASAAAAKWVADNGDVSGNGSGSPLSST